MISVSLQDFLSFKGGKHAPVTKEIPINTCNVISVYKHMAHSQYSFILESADIEKRQGRYSVIGLGSCAIIKVYGHRIILLQKNKIVKDFICEDPMQYIEQYHADYSCPTLANSSRYTGGLVGYFGYDIASYQETRLADIEQGMIPDICLMRTDKTIVLDRKKNLAVICLYTDNISPQGYEDACAQLENLALCYQACKSSQKDEANIQVAEANLEDITFECSKEDFMYKVDIIKEYIESGDIMQAVLSQKMSKPFIQDSLLLYQALRQVSPSPYMYYMNIGTTDIVGASPEIMCRVENDEVVVRPLAGTRKRGRDIEHDKKVAHELINDEKEIAEHTMLIDLGRNDLSRVSVAGTVHLTEQMVVERFSHVMHLTSNIVGTLKPNMSLIDVIKATHPAGTLSGASKIRAMEIIYDLESVKRQVYGGAIGYMGYDGSMDLAIAIRTAVVHDNMLYLQAGAGIVADSSAELEWKETINKARSVLTAVAMVESL